MNNFVDRPPIVNWLNAVLAQVSENLATVHNHLDELHKKYNMRASGSPAWFIVYIMHILKTMTKHLNGCKNHTNVMK